MARIARGVAVLTLGAGVVAAGFALARGPDLSLPGITQGASYGSPDYAPQAPAGAYEEVRPVHRKHASANSLHGVTTSSVCVRLCDGFFFPAAIASAGDAGCASQCPGAPTELYSMTSDKIDDAYSASTGAPYTKLPVAKHYQTERESTCSCHRDGVVSHANELLHDNTLRKGDIVMTADGFRVYEGAGWGASKAQEFVGVAKAGLPHEETAQLSAMEHANAGHVAPSAPTIVAQRPKGNVTVDDGPR
jgi:hypothetical protein